MGVTLVPCSNLSRQVAKNHCRLITKSVDMINFLYVNEELLIDEGDLVSSHVRM